MSGFVSGINLKKLADGVKKADQKLALEKAKKFLQKSKISWASFDITSRRFED